MSLFNYKAVDFKGKEVSGIVEAKNDFLAGDLLEERGFRVVSLSLITESWLTRVFRNWLGFLVRVTSKDRVVFLHQLAVLIAANVPIATALRAMIKSTKSINFRIIISSVLDEVEGGNKLSSALALHPDVFNEFYVNLARAGETSGRLSEVLVYLADKEEKDYDLSRRMRGMMVYPIFIFFSLVAVAIIMMVSVVPRLVGVLADSGVDLPWTTKLLINFSNFTQHYGLVMAIIIAAIIMAIRIYVHRTAEGKYGWDNLKLKIPVARRLLIGLYMVRWSQSLALLLRGGVDMVTGLQISATVTQNAVYQEFIFQVARKVEDGSDLATALAESELIPPMVYQMVQVGEQSGQVDQTLNQIYNFYSKEVTNGLESLVSLIEPIIIIIMGLGVGIMVSAVLMPMYKLAGAV